MAQKLKQNSSRHENNFPPEADGQFDVVADNEIAQWQEKLNARFGIGSGKLRAVENPVNSGT